MALCKGLTLDIVAVMVLFSVLLSLVGFGTLSWKGGGGGICPGTLLMGLVEGKLRSNLTVPILIYVLIPANSCTGLLAQSKEAGSLKAFRGPSAKMTWFKLH